MLWLCISSAYSSIILNDSNNAYTNFFIEYHHAKQDILTIKEVVQLDFKEDIPNRFAKGYINGANWFKFEINNVGTKRKYILHFNEVLFEHFDFYELIEGKWHQQQAGFPIALENRNIKHLHPTFLLDIEPNSSKTFYIYAKSKFSNLGEFSIYEYETFFTEVEECYKMYLVYFGILMMLILLNIFLYYRFKESIYIYYVGYTLFFMLFVMLFSGYILYFGLESIHYELHFAAPLFLLFLLLFSDKFLNIKFLLPKVHHILKAFVAILAILAILIVIDVYPWYQVMNVFATFVFILLLYAAITTMQKGNKKSVYYLVAISVYMFTILFMSSLANGWVSYTDFNRYAYLYGSCFEIIFFALMLVNRFYNKQRDQFIMQNELLEIKSKNEAYLQQEVEIRTKEIQEMNETLFGIVQDKELLLKELYHRVKNNFQMVVSLLWIELNKINSEEKKSRFENIINRIKSMSFMHDYLYNSNTLTNIKSENYILSIIDDVKRIYSQNDIIISTNLSDANINLNDAMNLGMIINEVLNNSIKHHDNSKPCEINLYFKKYDNKYLLSIQDNGPGFDANKSYEGLGMGMIQQFVNKLNEAEFIFINNHGTRFELSFKA